MKEAIDCVLRVCDKLNADEVDIDMVVSALHTKFGSSKACVLLAKFATDLSQQEQEAIITDCLAQIKHGE